MKLADVRYIAFEGGGGKGIVYLGAVRALEAANKLPLSKADREGETASDRLDGISGASAGAITVFFLALGMNADAIDKRTKAIDPRTGKPEFYGFYDDPQPGLYKGVHYRPGKGNCPTFVVDSPTLVREDRPGAGPSGETLSVATGMSILETGRQYDDRSIAEDKAAKLYKIYKFVYPLGFLKTLLRAGAARRKFKRAGRINQLAEKLSEQPSLLNWYVYSLLFDRGLFSGINIRSYLHRVMVEEICENFDVTISLEEAERLTYAQFHKITSNDLRIAGTNVTRGIPVYFSKDLTPDFPVVDSICMSMSIPFVFKPTLCQAWVDTRQTYESPHNVRYRGFFNDGGTLNNLPIHAFDFVGQEDNFMKKVVPLNQGMFGVRCTGGVPSDCAEDPKFPFDANYRRYLDEMAAKNSALRKNRRSKRSFKPEDVPTCVTAKPFQIDMESGALSPLVAFAGSLFNTLMYTSEDGQIRAENEAAQTTELYSYDVGLFDFTLPQSLSDFVQARAAIKLGAALDIDKATISTLVLKYYYGAKTDTAEVERYIDRAYKRAAADRTPP